MDTAFATFVEPIRNRLAAALQELNELASLQASAVLRLAAEQKEFRSLQLLQGATSTNDVQIQELVQIRTDPDGMLRELFGIKSDSLLEQWKQGLGSRSALQEIVSIWGTDFSTSL